MSLLVTIVGALLALASGTAVAGTGPAEFGPVRSAVQAPLWTWPLSGIPPVLRPFDPPPRPWMAGHRGVDLAAMAGEAVRAAGAGVVAFAGTVAGRGVVSIEHAGGLRTTYEPVVACVHIGDAVSVGQPIGDLSAGHLGCPVAACLHWGLRRGMTYLD